MVIIQAINLSFMIFLGLVYIRLLTRLKKGESRMNNVTCTLCRKEYHRKKSLIEKYNAGKILPFCSQSCYNSHRTKLIKIKCVNCGGEFDRQPAQISKNNFCSQSCSAKYNNTHKTKGNLRSKLEKYLEKQLTELYPNLEIHFLSLCLVFPFNMVTEPTQILQRQ